MMLLSDIGLHLSLRYQFSFTKVWNHIYLQPIVSWWFDWLLQRNTVAYDEDQPRDDLEKATVLRDAISDLPDVGSLYAVFPFIDGQL